MTCVHETVVHKEAYRCRLCGETWDKNTHGIPEGPGTALYRKLHDMGLPECDACKGRAFLMDLWGRGTCIQKLDVIAGWMRMEAVRAISKRSIDGMIRKFIEEVI